MKIINQKIDEEAKLLEVGVIKQNEYLKNIVPLKAELKKLEKESQRLKRKKQNLKDSVKNPTKGNIIIPSHESYKYASFSSRLVASLFDIILFGIPLVALAIFVPIIGAIVSSVLGVLYNPYFESSDWQGTPGKKIMGIIVVDLIGNRINFKTVLFRYLAKTLSGLIFCIGYFMMLFTERKQCLHDLIVETLVIKAH